MGFSQESGYVPVSIQTIMASIMANINTQFQIVPPYTMATFEGTNHYKNAYAQAQRMQENEIATSEIFLYLQNYFTTINARISRPVVTNPGIIEKLESEGYIASVKPMIEADAGKINIAVDVDDGVHATGTVTITSFANLVSGTADVITINGTAFTAQAGAATPGTGTFQAATSVSATAASLASQINAHATASLVVKATSLAGVVTLTAVHGGLAGNALTIAYTNNDANVGATVSGATLTGGLDYEGAGGETYPDVRTEIGTLISQITVAGAVTQGTEVTTIVLSNGQSFDFKYHLPDRLQVLLRLTITLSENNQFVIETQDNIKLKLLDNILANYRLGKNFEPQKYFTVEDAPWASQVLLEYSINGGAYSSAVYNADFDELFDIKLENINLVEV